MAAARQMPSLVPAAGGRLMVEPRDVGTLAVVVRELVPGADLLYWRELRVEEDAFAWDVPAHNAAMVAAAGDVDVAPWPEKVARCAPVDITARYDFAVRLQLLQRASLLAATDPQAWGEVPDGLARIIDPRTPVDPFDRGASHLTGQRSQEEIRAESAEPWRFLRLPFRNEVGACDFKRPAVFRWDGLQAARFTFRLEDDPLFVPFDLSHPERYAWFGEDGSPLEGGEAFAEVGAGADLVLYLVPRRWRLWIHCWVHYEWITWFEQVPNDEQFIRIFYDRPPFYPVRHDVVHSAGQADLWHDYEEAWLSWDSGVDSKVTGSAAAAALRHEIVMQQWYSLCTAYVLTGVEPAKVTIWQDPPRVGEIVAGIGHRSRSLGVERPIWAVQATDASALYPRTVIGEFYNDFYNSPVGGGSEP